MAFEAKEKKQYVQVCYFYRKASALQLNLIRKFTDLYKSDGWFCCIQTAKPKADGKCDWFNDGVMIKLSTQELATIAKYVNPVYLKRLQTPVIAKDNAGNPVIDDKTGKPSYEMYNGSPKLFSEIFAHTKTGSMLIFKANPKNPLGCSIYTKNAKNNVTIYLNENETYELALMCQWSLEFLANAAYEISENVIEAWRKNPNKDSKNNNQIYSNKSSAVASEADIPEAPAPSDDDYQPSAYGSNKSNDIEDLFDF